MPSNPRESWATDSDLEHLASSGKVMSPKLQQWAQGPTAQLLNLGVTLVAAIGVPVIGWVGARVIDELVTLNRAVSSIQQTNAASRPQLSFLRSSRRNSLASKSAPFWAFIRTQMNRDASSSSVISGISRSNVKALKRAAAAAM